MSATPPTIFELLERATPGPWMARRRSDGDSGFVQANEPGKPYGTEILGEDYWPHRSRAADVDYIARLSPDVVRQVVEFLQELETAEDRSNLDGDSAEVVLQQINDEAERLLRVLDGLGGEGSQ